MWTDCEMEAGEGKRRLYRANLARRDQLMMQVQLALAANAHKQTCLMLNVCKVVDVHEEMI